MPIADKSTSPRFSRTPPDTEKKQVAADNVLKIARRCVNGVRRDLRRIAAVINQSPGTKAQVLAELTTAESDELELIFTAMKAIGNTHKPADTPTLDEAIFDPKSDQDYINEAS